MGIVEATSAQPSQKLVLHPESYDFTTLHRSALTRISLSIYPTQMVCTSRLKVIPSPSWYLFILYFCCKPMGHKYTNQYDWCAGCWWLVFVFSILFRQLTGFSNKVATTQLIASLNDQLFALLFGTLVMDTAARMNPCYVIPLSPHNLLSYQDCEPNSASKPILLDSHWLASPGNGENDRC